MDLDYEALMKANPDDYPLFTLDGVKTIGKFCTNYDGDTCHILMNINGVLQKHNVRMMGYDSPEMKPALTDPKRDEKKKAAVAAKERLAVLCSNRILYIHCQGRDKYGRQLASVYLDATYSGKSVNEQMIEDGHGYMYFGGKRQ
jgi:endonuclease YncB( thermonuclease family)